MTITNYYPCMPASPADDAEKFTPPPPEGVKSTWQLTSAPSLLWCPFLILICANLQNLLSFDLFQSLSLSILYIDNLYKNEAYMISLWVLFFSQTFIPWMTK